MISRYHSEKTDHSVFYIGLVFMITSLTINWVGRFNSFSPNVKTDNFSANTPIGVSVARIMKLREAAISEAKNSGGTNYSYAVNVNE